MTNVEEIAQFISDITEIKSKFEENNNNVDADTLKLLHEFIKDYNSHKFIKEVKFKDNSNVEHLFNASLILYKKIKEEKFVKVTKIIEE